MGVTTTADKELEKLMIKEINTFKPLIAAISCARIAQDYAKDLLTHEDNTLLSGYMIEVTHRNETEKQRWIPHYNHKLYRDEKAAHGAMENWSIRYRLVPLYSQQLKKT